MSIDWNKRMRNVWKAKKVKPNCMERDSGGNCERLKLSIQHKQATNFQRIKSIKMQIHAYSLMLSSICRYIIWGRGGEGEVALRHELFSRQLDSPKCISNVCATERQKVQMKFAFSSLSLSLIECVHVRYKENHMTHIDFLLHWPQMTLSHSSLVKPHRMRQ